MLFTASVMPVTTASFISFEESAFAISSSPIRDVPTICAIPLAKAGFRFGMIPGVNGSVFPNTFIGLSGRNNIFTAI